MDKNSVLDPEKMKLQGKEISQLLEKYNLDYLENIKTNLYKGIDYSNAEGDAANVLKEKMSDYIILVLALLYANDCDKHDIRRLKEIVGNEKLIGSDILSGQDEELKAYEYDKAESERLYDLYLNTEVYRIFTTDYYYISYLKYKHLANKDYEAYTNWVKKEQKYDEIDSETKELFKTGMTFKESILDGLNDLTDGLTADKNWREKLLIIRDESIKKCASKYFTIDEKGNKKYNWKEMEKFSWKDASKLDEMDLAAFAYVIENMDVKDINKLFEYDKKIAFKDQYHISMTGYPEIKYSDNFKKTLDYYYFSAMLDAKLKLYGSNPLYDYRTPEYDIIVNNMTKAIALNVVYDKMKKSTGIFEETSFSVKTETGIDEYQIGLCNWNAIEDIKSKITVSNAFCNIDSNIDKAVEYDLHKQIFGSQKKFNIITSNVVGTGVPMIISTLSEGAALGNGLSLLFCSYAIADGFSQALESQRIAIVDIKRLETGNHMEAIGAYGNVINYSGDSENKTELMNVMVDRAELEFRLKVYKADKANITDVSINEVDINNESDDIVTYDEFLKYLENKCENDDKVKEYFAWYETTGSNAINKAKNELLKNCMEE